MGQTVLALGQNLLEILEKYNNEPYVLRAIGPKKGGFCWKEGVAVSLIIFLARVWQM